LTLSRRGAYLGRPRRPEFHNKRRFMSRLEEAQQRLETALARLEAAAGGAIDEAAGSESLRREAAAARRRYDTLEAGTREVAKRLDAAIGRIHAILDH